MHTLPTIHTREFSAKSQRLGEAQIQSIVHPCLQPLQHQVNQSFGANPKFSFKGQLHWPKPSRSMAPFEQFQIQEVLRLLSTSENHVKVEMEGSGEGPVSLSQSLQLTFSGKMFQKKSVSDLDNSLTKFQDFYANWNQFQHDQVSNGRDLQAQLNGQIKMIKERNSVYQHSQNLRIRFRNVVPGIKDYVGVRASLKTDCEDTMRYCDIDCQFRMGEEVEVEKTLPLTLLRVKQKASVSFILPETSASVEEFQKARESTDKFVSMVMRVDAEYEAEAQTELGRGRKLEQGGRQNISMRVHGDTAWTPEETEMLPKINKFYAKTKLEGEQLTGPHTPEYISRWNNMESVAYVDPHTRRSEPADSKGPSSVQELLAAASLTTRARCWANGRTLSTFQQISYEAPLSQCYSVLAKDCDSSEEKPRFIVLMKKIGGRAKDGYKLKVITAQETVEAMPSPERDDSYEQEMSQLEVKVNGETYRKSSSSTVRFLNEKKTEIGVDVEGLHIRFNGQEVWLKVSKGQQPDVCGVCEGIEGEDVDQEQNQEKDQQISQLHRKFSVAQPDDQGTCSQSLLDDFYAQTKMGRKPSGKANQQRDEQEQFGSAEEEDNKEKKMIEPVAFIQMQEYKHKVCFSTSPISACPKGSSPATSSSDEEEETAKVVSATFACLERADVQTRQMIRVARRAGVVFKNSKAREQQEWLEGIVSGLAQSYAEDVKIPKSCMLD
uniref:VWFD domain-containing protein n=1 Tax=Ditylenchus dipsaci TaxID=166011 RepID=A0A915E9Q8_9BILA